MFCEWLNTSRSVAHPVGHGDDWRRSTFTLQKVCGSTQSETAFIGREINRELHHCVYCELVRVVVVKAAKYCLMNVVLD